MSGQLRVRGRATADELAAVLAVLARSQAEPAAVDGYARWRQVRLAAVRRDLDASSPG